MITMINHKIFINYFYQFDLFKTLIELIKYSYRNYFIKLF